MKRERFSEEKIVGVLREAEKGEKPVTDLCREHGIAEQTFYRWRRKYGGLDTSMEVFYSLAEATTITEMWRQIYNHQRPHSSLDYQTPAEFAAGWNLEYRPDAQWELHPAMP